MKMRQNDGKMIMGRIIDYCANRNLSRQFRSAHTVPPGGFGPLGVELRELAITQDESLIAK